MRARLQDHPRMNAVQTEEGFRLMDRVNIGLAVSLPEGLVTPVLRDAASKSLGQIASEARVLAAKTRENRATPEDLAGGSFTVTNLGPTTSMALHRLSIRRRLGSWVWAGRWTSR